MTERKIRQLESNIEFIEATIEDLREKEDIENNEDVKTYYESLIKTRDSIRELIEIHYGKQ